MKLDVDARRADADARRASRAVKQREGGLPNGRVNAANAFAQGFSSVVEKRMEKRAHDDAASNAESLASRQQLQESLRAMQRALFREQARVKEFQLRGRAQRRESTAHVSDLAVLVAQSAAAHARTAALSAKKLFPDYSIRSSSAGAAEDDDGTERGIAKDVQTHEDAGRVPFSVGIALVLYGYARPVRPGIDATAAIASAAAGAGTFSSALLDDPAIMPADERAAHRTQLLRAAVDLRRMSECALLLRESRHGGGASPDHRATEESRIEVAGIPLALHRILLSISMRTQRGLQLNANDAVSGGSSGVSDHGDHSSTIVMERVLHAVANEQTAAWEALLGDSVLVEIERLTTLRNAGRGGGGAGGAAVEASRKARITDIKTSPSSVPEGKMATKSTDDDGVRRFTLLSYRHQLRALSCFTTPLTHTHTRTRSLSRALHHHRSLMRCAGHHRCQTRLRRLYRCAATSHSRNWS